MIPVASVVTEKTIREFSLLKESLEQYHKCYWALSCDQVAYEKYSSHKNVECLNIIDPKDCNHDDGKGRKDGWMNVMMTKFDVAELLINKFGHSLFLDSDMIFVNKIQDSVLNLFENKDIDAIICQHMTDNYEIEEKHGLYNAGMFHLKNIQFLNDWRDLSKDYKKYNLFFEQQPLEYIQRKYVTANFPINYNMGWWRFNQPKTKKRLSMLKLKDDRVMFEDMPVVNFHVHIERKSGYPNYGLFLLDKIKSLIEQSKNQEYQLIKKYL